MPGVVNCRGTEEQRFWSKVRIADNGCWEWQRATHKFGYGMFGLETKIPYEYETVTAHSWAYKKYVGEVPQGKELDHLCRNPKCVNPLHLEAVPPRINKLRGISPAALAAKQTSCIWGHELNPENVWVNPNTGARYCRTCKARRDREYQQRKKQRAENLCLI